jgi:hypothetical protein
VEHWELVAREQIRDLVGRYNTCGDSGRLDEMMQLFAADATLELGGRIYRGVPEIRALFDSAVTSTRARPGAHIRHFTATHRIEVTNAVSARGRCYFLVLTENGLDHWGRYVDAYLREHECWYFEKRRVAIDGHTAGGWAERQGFGGSDASTDP